MATVDSNTDEGVVSMDTGDGGESGERGESGESAEAANGEAASAEQGRRRCDRRHKSFCEHKRRLRPSIEPGVILILLTGIHKGKRVVFLKQLQSGLLLVTGPFRLNGCPIRRVHQNMVIATKTKLDISSIAISDHINDEYFCRRESRSHDRKKISSDVNNIFAKSKKQYVLKDVRKEDQKSLDAQIMNAIRNREDKSIFARYLRSLFTLTSHDLPHKMQF